MDNEFFSPLTVVKRLAPLCLVVTLAYTFGWTAFVARHEVRTGNHPDLESLAIATFERVGQVDTLILIYSVATTIALDFLGGTLMVTARYLGNKFVQPLIERHKAVGREEGIATGMVKGREEGISEGIAVGRVEGREEGIATGEADANRRWTEWNSRRVEAERAGVSFDEPPPAS